MKNYKSFILIVSVSASLMLYISYVIGYERGVKSCIDIGRDVGIDFGRTAAVQHYKIDGTFGSANYYNAVRKTQFIPSNNRELDSLMMVQIPRLYTHP